MRNSFKILFYVKGKNVKGNGKVPLMGRITMNGEMAQFSTKVDIDTKLWDAKSCSAIGRSLDASAVNTLLNNIRGSLATHLKILLPIMN